MNTTVRTVLSLTSSEAIYFFMKSEQYHGFELPEYFVFDGVLQYVKREIGSTSYKECLHNNINPNDLTDVNFDILLNKDESYYPIQSIL